MDHRQLFWLLTPHWLFFQGGAGGTFDVTIIHSEKEKPADGPGKAQVNCLLTDSCSPSIS